MHVAYNNVPTDIKKSPYWLHLSSFRLHMKWSFAQKLKLC